MTQDAARPRKGSGISVAGWPLRRKMALALTIPLLLAATLGGLRVQGDLADSRQAASSAQQVTILQPAVDYLTASEAAMVAAQSDSAASQGDLIDAIGDVIDNAETLVQTRDTAGLNDLQAAHVDALLDLSQAMRAQGAEDLGPATWIALVRQLESSVSQLITSVNSAQKTPEPRLEQLSQAMSGRLSLALQQGFVATALAQSDSQELFSEIGVEAAAIDRLAGSVEGGEDQTALLRTQNTRHAGQIRDNAATNLDGRDAYTPYDEISAMLIGGVTDSLDLAASEARRNALVGALLTLVALGAAIGIAFIIARSLLEPIGRVREGALAVARHRLPDAVARIRAGQQPEPIKPIDVTTNEEIGQVARAVDDLHRQAIHLASGEAQLRQTVNAMFVTLSRRSTSLINQQLAQIERLEHDEEDPKRLESLFRLDHLASRMRRTADSLLVLADAPNRAAGQFSLTAGEALQAATSAVQNYQRVQVMSHLATRISDEAAPDLVHLLTELVDNALTYSPPAEPVRLAATLGADGVTITITDSGLGVPPAELELLNRDLEHGAEATPDTARRMGLFVVSRLAERHGIHVRLARNLGGGMTVTVLLPPAILPDLPRTAAPADDVATASVAAPKSPAAQAPAAQAPAPKSPSVEPAAVRPTVESKREARTRLRAEKAEAKLAAKAAAKEAKEAKRGERAKAAEAKADGAKASEAKAAEAKASEVKAAEVKAAEVQAAQAKTDQSSQAPADEATKVAGARDDGPGSTDRPSLESLLPRREPGANMPRTGADAFLSPETSGETGPLFGKRTPQPTAEGTGTDETSAAAAAGTAPDAAQKVASVVPITALASRQRAQAEQARVAAESDADEEEAVEEPVRAHDPLSDPLPADAYDEPADEQVDPEQTSEQLGEQVDPEPATDPEPEAEAMPAAESTDLDDDHDEHDEHDRYLEVDADDPLGLGSTPHEQDVEPVAEATAPVAELPDEPVAEATAPVAELLDEPVAEEVVPEAAEWPAVEAPAASVGTDLTTNGVSHGLLHDGESHNGESHGESHDGESRNGESHNGEPHNGAEPAVAGNSPIFKALRPGWRADEGTWQQNEIDRGWEIAEHAQGVPVVESTVAGLPRRAPGERLVPGSVTPPTAAKTRDPEAIRRRLQAHTAGVSRGRRVAQSSSQHTEAGPA